MIRRRVARAGLAMFALGAGLLAQPSPVDAASQTKAGWWYRTSDPDSVVPGAARPPVSPPDAPIDPVAPNVAEGSVLVEGTPEGATAIAGLTYLLSDGESSPVLTITPSEGSSVPPEAVILACRAAVDWAPLDAQPGRWQDKPLVDCGRSVNGIVADGTITFPLESLLSGTDLDVVLVPGTAGETPAGPVGSAFSLTFDVLQGAVLTTSAPSVSTGSSTSFTPPPPTSGSSSFSPPGGSSFSAPSAPVVAPALEPQEQAPTVPDQPMLAAPAATATEDDTAQGVAFIILLVGAALAGLAYLTPERSEAGTVGLGRFKRPAPADALVAAAQPVEGGLGRFARPRLGAPPSLS